MSALDSIQKSIMHIDNSMVSGLGEGFRKTEAEVRLMHLWD